MFNFTSLHDLNLRLTYYFIPTYVLICLIFIVGSFGNSLLLYNYFMSFKRTSHWYFVVTLALYDLLICMVVMPFGFLNLYQFYLFTSKEACQLIRMVESVSIVGSMCILICIAAHTYVKICHPFYYIKISFIKSVCWSTFLGTVILHVPIALTAFGVGKKETADPDLMGCNCDIADGYRGSILVQGYRFLLVVIAITVLTSFAVFYGLVIRKMRKQHEIFVRKLHIPATPTPLFSEEQGNTPSTQVSVIADSGFTISPAASLPVTPSMERGRSLQLDSISAISLDVADTGQSQAQRFADTGQPQTLPPSENSTSMTLTASAGPKLSSKGKSFRNTSKEPINLPTGGENVLKEKRGSGNAGERKACAKIKKDRPNFNTSKAGSTSQKESFTSCPPPPGTCGINESTQPAPPLVEESPGHQNNKENKDSLCAENSVSAPLDSSGVEKDLGQDRKDSSNIQRVLAQNPDVLVSRNLPSPAFPSRKIKFQSGSQSASSHKIGSKSKSHSDSLSSGKSNVKSKSAGRPLGKTWQKERFPHHSSRASDVRCEKVVQSADSLPEPMDEGLNHRKSSRKENFICSENARSVSPVQESCTLKADSGQDEINPSNIQTTYTHPNVSVPSISDTVRDSHWKEGFQSWIQKGISGTQVITQGTDQYSTPSLTTNIFQPPSKSSGFRVDSEQGKNIIVFVESCVDLPNSSQVSVRTFPSRHSADPETVCSNKPVGNSQPSSPQPKQSAWNMKIPAPGYPLTFNESTFSQAVGQYGCCRKIQKKCRLMDNASLSVVAISIAFVLCSLPFVALVEADALNTTDFVTLGIIHFLIKFSYVQNAIHPLIYLVANRKLREIVMMQFSAGLALCSRRRQAQL